MEFTRPKELFIPRRFQKAEFDNKTNKGLKAVADEFYNNFDHYYELGIGPAFFGLPGIGKTHVAAALAKRLFYQKEVAIYWVDAVYMFNSLLDLRDFRKSEYFGLRKKLMNYPVLVIDDFTQLQDYSRIIDLFFQVVNIRYGNRIPTIFTGVVDPSKDVWKVIAELFNNSISRRIELVTKGLVYTS